MTPPDGPTSEGQRSHGEAAAPVRPQFLRIGLVAALVVLVDQLTKSWAVARLGDETIDVFWTLRFNLSFNSGLAFSQGRGLTPLITVVGVLLVGGLIVFSRRVTSRLTAIALGLLIGGACGNLADRLFRNHDGAVVDFIDFQWWPVFNVADSAISIGAVLLVFSNLRGQPDD